MFFRRERPKNPTFEERLNQVKSLGFTVIGGAVGGGGGYLYKRFKHQHPRDYNRHDHPHPQAYVNEHQHAAGR